MTAIAEFTPRPGYRFLLDRSELLGPLFIAPAILYVLVLVALPFFLAIYYSISAFTIYDPSYRFVGAKNFFDVNRQVRRHAVDAGVPRPRSRPRARGAAVGGAGVAGHARLAMDVRLALQRDQLDADRDRAGEPRASAAVARPAGPRDDRRNRRACLAAVPVRGGDLHRWVHFGAERRARRRNRRRRGLLAAELPDHSAHHRADRGDRADLRHCVHLHRPERRLPLDQRWPDQRHAGPRIARLPGRHTVGGRRPRCGHLPVPVPLPAD